jgi:predicted RNA-binding Zn-ribbon protein involved in translation (DUF1610 family)
MQAGMPKSVKGTRSNRVEVDPLGSSILPARIHGPYPYSDGSGRKFVIITYVDGSRESTAYARWLWEQKHGNVPDGFHVHHRDGDCTNDALDNLAVMRHAEHNAHHAKPAEMITFTCPECGGEAVRAARHVRHAHKQGKDGPYCSKRCAGIASHR